ncbi:MAG: histidinol dehydrogenase [Rhodospirillaceae bacterium]
MIIRLDTADPQFEAQLQTLLCAPRTGTHDVHQAVAAILADVRDRGDAAVFEYTKSFDHFELTPDTLRISDAEIDAAVAACCGETRAALELAAERITAFHALQLPQGFDHTDDYGIRLGVRWTPLDAVGLYVPGGTAAYPSSVLMTAIPAKVAGVGRLVMVVPTPSGRVDTLVLAAARLAGVDEIYRVGGAQAIGALAFGTASIKPVDKIVGPGNAYVAEAKRQVYGVVGIDMIAGPSELLIIADNHNDPEWIAADLLSQAEHDTFAQTVLITNDEAFADLVVKAVKTQLANLPRRDIATKSWENHGVVILVKRDFANAAAALCNLFAPEHLQLAVADPDLLLPSIRHAGSIFLGRHTPEALGDYVAGPNHVLPTARSARFSSGLNVLDFMKRSTFIGCNAAGLASIGPAAITLARAEGLEAHARSVAIRLQAFGHGTST